MNAIYYVFVIWISIYAINSTKIKLNNKQIINSDNYSNFDKFKNAKPKNILELSLEEKKKFIDSFDLVLADCDGVLWNVNESIEGTGDAINLIKHSGKKIGYISNNSLRTEENYLELFNKNGIKININDLFHPLRNIISYLKKIKFEGLIYYIGSNVMKNGLIEAGFRVIDGPNKIINETFKEFAMHIFDKEPVDCVIMDFDINMNNLKLTRAQQYLKKTNTIFIVGANEAVVSAGNGIEFLGPGGYISILQEATGKNPILMGKPGNSELLDIIVDAYNIRHKNKTLMVGDMLEQDIGFGKFCGFQTLLVLTGGSKKEDFDKIKYCKVLPDYYAESLADFKTFFDNLKL